MRHTILHVLLFALVCVSAKAEQTNIVLLMGDDHGWEETGYNDHPFLQTPVLDEMAKSCLRLDRFYAAHPSCSPTRGSVMTGRHPNRYGTFAPNWSIRPQEITIAHLLNRAGYQCGHFGKWHLGPVKAYSPTNPGVMGFHEWLSHDNFFELNPQFSRNGGPPEKFQGESSEILIDQTIQFIDKAIKNDKPFFTVVWFGSPHQPYSGLDKDLALYDDLPQKYANKKVKVTSNETGNQTKRPLRDVLRERYAEITAMDRSIGTLRTALKQRGVKDKTLIWYCGDNGTPADGQAEPPLRGAKGQMYEGGIRVPGLIEWPERIAKPRTSDLISATTDMLPTLCSVAKIPLPDRTLDGVDLLPLIDGEIKERPKPLFFWSYGGTTPANAKPWIEPELQVGTTPLVKLMNGKPTRTFRNFHQSTIGQDDFRGSRVAMSNQYKLIITGRGDKEKHQLFELKVDPAETNDLSQTKPAVTRAMLQQLRQWQESVLASLQGGDYQ